MKITIKTNNILKEQTDVLIIPIFEDIKKPQGIIKILNDLSNKTVYPLPTIESFALKSSRKTIKPTTKRIETSATILCLSVKF